MLWCLAFLALCASAQGRAVNISNTWVLPEEGFPVFYRYFRDRISWYEADAVCQFHHANLVTVDTTAQYDAVRAYLKEIDITSAVWVGLIRSNPDGDFTWTDYRGLSGDGYWSAAPDSRDAPLCAAADPAADYRWEARSCGGPMVASFICELPVPQWALGVEGCMVRALPALTILYLPESASVQLTADCGLAGVKKVQCTGNVKREDLLKELSCFEYSEDDSGNSSTSSIWPSTTTDNYISKDSVSTEDVATPQQTEKHSITVSTVSTITPNTIKPFITKQANFQNKKILTGKEKKERTLNSILANKNINLDVLHNNNLQSNDIPKLLSDDDLYLTEKLNKQLEDEQNMQHKFLHEEIARRGNFETIFTQPTDHFVPPLVMAKARLSDDMTVISLEEKHAQQLAEERLSKQKIKNNDITTIATNKLETIKSTIENINTDVIHNKFNKDTQDSVIADSTTELNKIADNLKLTKYGLPKKYNIKNNDLKIKNGKAVDLYSRKSLEKSQEFSLNSTTNTVKPIEITTVHVKQENISYKNNDDPMIELKVIITEPETIENISTNSKNASTNIDNHTTLDKQSIIQTAEEFTTIDSIRDKISDSIVDMKPSSNNYIVPKITSNVFEYTSISPFVTTKNSYIQSSTTMSSVESIKTSPLSHVPSPSIDIITSKDIELNGKTDIKITATSPGKIINDLTTSNPILIIKQNNDSTATSSPVTTLNNFSTDDKVMKNETIDQTTLASIVLQQNGTEIIHVTEQDILKDYNTENHTDYIINATEIIETEATINDFQSPLLSGASEPLPKPKRLRRPQTPNRNKFNPFRILG